MSTDYELGFVLLEVENIVIYNNKDRLRYRVVKVLIW